MGPLTNGRRLYDAINVIPVEMKLLEMLVASYEALSVVGQLKIEQAKELEQVVNQVYETLERVTYDETLSVPDEPIDLKTPEQANHPVKPLWDRWKNASDQTHVIARRFLQPA